MEETTDRDSDAAAVLVRDTLYCRRMGGGGCFIHNAAAEELDAWGPAILPIIETVVLADVDGNCPMFEDKRHDAFPGLRDLMWSYFGISDRFNLHANASSFLRRISFGARLDALDAIHRGAYWEKPLPAEFRATLADIRQHVTGDEREVIDAILQRHPPRKWWPWGAAS